MKLRIRVLLATAAVCLVAAAPAAAETETQTAGNVTATFSYTKGADNQYTGLRLQVVRAGATAFDGAPTNADCDMPFCIPIGAAYGSGKSLTVADVDGDGEPEVWIDVTTGGAHCCELSQLLRWNGSAYRQVSHDWFDAGYTLDTPAGGGPATFVSADTRFAYEFAAFAFSAFPVQLWALRDGAFADVTGEHLDAVHHDAARWGKRFKRTGHKRLPLGVVAAWVADKERLGQGKEADAFLRKAARAGRLRSDDPKVWPNGKRYITVLHKDLRRWGYIK